MLVAKMAHFFTKLLYQERCFLLLVHWLFDTTAFIVKDYRVVVRYLTRIAELDTYQQKGRLLYVDTIIFEQVSKRLDLYMQQNILLATSTQQV